MPTIYYDEVPTPLGNMQVGITEKGICMFEFPIEERIIGHKKKISETHTESTTKPNNVFGALKMQMNEYFEDGRSVFDLPIDLIGTEFQCQVWKSLLQVPFGKTISYLELAVQLGNPKSVRAVAQANGQNRLPIIVPCHRIIASNGKLTGYSGGLWRKEILLSKENGQSRLIF
ncbi:MAG: cysteine methyltransferase [Fluviicola sp.]|nr:MAG: cysteine methyltransferase [Fluviicola sp.]